MSFSEAVDKYFRLSERGSDPKTELKGALLVFLSMSYILVVNPGMMADAGMDQNACYTATVLITIFGCLVMGLYANYPVAQAPAMGINAFFVYTVVITMGYQWDTALAAVFISGVLFFLISMSSLRTKFLNAIPDSLRRGIAAGIGCFIVLIGLNNAGVIASNVSTLVQLGDLSDPAVLLSLFCLSVTIIMAARKMKLAIFWGMLLTAIVGIIIGVIAVPGSLFATPEAPNFGNFIDGFHPEIFDLNFIMVIISFVFVIFFDSTGTLMALSDRAGIGLGSNELNVDLEANRLDAAEVADVKAREKGLRKAFMSDAAATTLSGVIGSTPCSSYAESSVGIESGSRTGLMAVFVAMFFFIALFVGPLFSVIDFHCTVGAMFMVGVAMITELRKVEWSDQCITISVLSTILFMVLTYSITNGIAFGIIMYCLAMIGAGRARDVNKGIYVVAIISLAYFLATAFNF